VDVDEQEIDTHAVEHREGVIGGTRLQDLESVGSQFVTDSRARQDIVFDDQNGGRRQVWESRDRCGTHGDTLDATQCADDGL